VRRGVLGGLLAVCAAVARADGEPTSGDVVWTARWKSGDVVTVERHVASELTTTSGETRLATESSSLDATYVVRCDKADADGAPVMRTVWFRTWKRVQDGVADTSLADRQILVEGAAWKVADGDAPSAQARNWLDETFVERRAFADVVTMLAPPARLTIGAEWKPEAKVVRAAFLAADPAAPVAETCSLAWKLVSADGGRLRAEISAKLPLAGLMRGLAAAATIAPQSAMEVAATWTGDAASRLADSVRVETKLALTIEVGGEPQVTQAKRVDEEKRTLGGEMPVAVKPMAPTAPESK
jgi:hypothetical protein